MNSYVIGIEPNEDDGAANNTTTNNADQTGNKTADENLNISDDMTNKENKSRSGSTAAQQQQQQQMMAKNANKVFRPILSFIGVDAPSGTLIDNLFKEFGSLLFGNLKIKSVHINILGSALSMSRLLGADPSSVLSSSAPPASSTNLNGSLLKGSQLNSSQSHFRTNKSFYR